jgi:predicted transcriptional regulator
MVPEWPSEDHVRQSFATDSSDRFRVGSDRGADEPLSEEQRPSLAEAMTTVFDLGPCERAVYRHLVGDPATTTRELARSLDVDRSSVNRSLTTLRDRGLATRRPNILEEGGQVYLYTAHPPAEVRERLHAGVDEWAAAAHDRVDAFLADVED